MSNEITAKEAAALASVACDRPIDGKALRSFARRYAATADGQAHGITAPGGGNRWALTPAQAHALIEAMRTGKRSAAPASERSVDALHALVYGTPEEDADAFDDGPSGETLDAAASLVDER